MPVRVSSSTTSPAQALGFGKDPFSHTRWDFDT
jgi:hypothetical protein